MKKLMIFLSGFILGVIVIIATYETTISNFLEYHLSDQENMAAEEFNYYSEQEGSENRQDMYFGFAKELNELGLISTEEYQKALVIVPTRLCIIYEDKGNIEIANKMCILAKNVLSQWRSDLDFETFKQKLIDARDKKEPPDF